MANTEPGPTAPESPAKIDQPDTYQTNWLSSLRFKLGVGLLGLFLLLVVLNLWFIWSKGLPMLIQQNKEFNAQLGENLVASLDQHLKQAEALAKDIANIAEVLPNDSQLYHELMPNLLDMESLQSLVTGGGIWPEPYHFNESIERHSFFWGRDQEGKLQFFNDYNQDSGPGYHQEEWYVPTSLLANGSAYWSRSYTDPYSLQPMVTCSVPIYKNDQFSGVATVDLALDGVAALLKAKFKDHPGYAFIIDRNNTFISHPNQSLVSDEHRPSDQPNHIDFIDVEKLALTEPVFKPLARQLRSINQMQSDSPNSNATELKEIADKIAQRSYQIGKTEAKTIAQNMLQDGGKEIVSLANFKLSDDLILKKEIDVTVYQIPHTHWKVVTVFPFEESIRVAMNISKTVTWISLCGILLWGAICALFLRQVLFSRLREMTIRIRQSVTDGQEILLEQNSNDELGVLAQWFNHRTHQLQLALEASKHNAVQLESENHNHRSTTRQLEKSLSLQNAMLDSVHLAILSLDIEGRIVSANAGTTKILGYEANELIGKLFPAFLIDDTQLTEFKKQFKSERIGELNVFELLVTELEAKEHSQQEWVFDCKSGARIPALLTVTAVLDTHQCIDGWLAVITDLSSRTKA